MALEHDFLIIPTAEMENLQKTQKCSKKDNNAWSIDDAANVEENAIVNLITFYKKKRNESVRVHDDYILQNLCEFKNVCTFEHGFVPYKGLNYYGFTLIPPQSLMEFRDVLKKISHGTEFDLLISLCDIAYSNRSGILHCGI